MAEKEDTATVAGKLDEALLKAISHPLRHRLLGLLDDRTASPNELARELGLPLGRVSYPIRLLADRGVIGLVRPEPRRGALEHFYRAVTRGWFSEEDWARLPRSARRGIAGRPLPPSLTRRPAAGPPGGRGAVAAADLQRRHGRGRRGRVRRPGEPGHAHVAGARRAGARRGRRGDRDRRRARPPDQRRERRPPRRSGRRPDRAGAAALRAHVVGRGAPGVARLPQAG